MKKHVNSPVISFTKRYNSEIYLASFILLISLSLPASNPLPELYTGILYILVFVLLQSLNKEEINLKKHIKNLTEVNDHSAYGIIGALGMLGITSWNFDLFMEGKVIYACMFAVNFVNFIYFYFLFMPDKLKDISDKLEKRKVLISAAPYNYVKSKERAESAQETISEKLSLIDIITGLDEKKHNWSLPIKSINFHGKTLEQIWFLVTSSDEGNAEYNAFKEALNTLKERFGLSFEINEKEDVNFNDPKSIKSKTREILHEVKKQGYLDGDISFNISTGTSLISTVFMIFCFIPQRQAEYYVQGNKDHGHPPIRILPDTEDVKNI